MPRDYEALTAYLADRFILPFDWGWDANDCVSHAAGAIEAMLGKRVLGRLRWSNEIGAAKLIKRGGGLVKMIDARLTPIAPAMAQRGDVVGVPGDYLGGYALLIVDGANLVGPGGMIERRSAMTLAWSAG